MRHKNYCLVSGVLFGLVALAHLLRIVLGVAIQLDDYVVPMFLSWVAFLVPAALAVWGFRIARERSA